MEGEVEESSNERSFSNVSIPKRMAIVAAGAIVNIVFAIVVYFILMCTSNQLISNQVDVVLEGYVSEEIGLQKEDRIISINNEKVDNFYEISDVISTNNGEEVTFEVERDSEILEYTTKLTEVNTKNAGIYISQNFEIVFVEKNGPSDNLLYENDKVISINGLDLEDEPMNVYNYIQESEEYIAFEIERNGHLETIEVIPDVIPEYYIGIVFEEAPKTFINGIIYASVETKNFLASVFENIKMLFTGNVGVNQMTGPIGISTMVANTNGVKEFAYLFAMISLSLGVTNLLPIPALDGGKLLILTVEAVRKKPIGQNIEMKIQMLGFAIILGLTVVVTYNDVIRLFK